LIFPAKPKATRTAELGAEKMISLKRKLRKANALVEFGEFLDAWKC